jgi:U2 small nuclear ribonucleoprotein A'
LTDNDIRALANFPVLTRIHTLIVANNLISRLDVNLAKTLPRLTTLVLTNNALTELSSLNPLGRFSLLEYLTLMGNPVTRKKHYREYVIWKCKNVRVLDFQRIKEKERLLAKELMETTDGRPSALAISLSSSGGVAGKEKAANGVAKTFEVGSTVAQAGAAGRKMTAEERRALEEAIERSTSLDEIKKLEDRLRLGYSITAMVEE